MKKICLHTIGIISLISISLLLGAVGWQFMSSLNTDNESTITNKATRQTGYQYISPLLECSDVRYIKRSEIEEAMKKLIDDKINSNDIVYASVYFRDLNNGPWIGINELEKFTPASLLKVPLLIAYLKIAENNQSILTKKIAIHNDQGTLTQNITPSSSVEVGKEYTVDELLQRMIIFSDNQAANTLLENIEIDVLNKTYSDLGVAIPSGGGSSDFMSVRDYASFFRILYNASYLNHSMSEKALGILAKSKFDKGLKAGVPSEVEVAHKFGERIFENKNQLHDCGIVYKEEKPYLLCIMTRGSNFDKMSETIKELSALVYDRTN